MTITEKKRDMDQKRVADAVQQYESIRENQRNNTILVVVACVTLFGSIITYVAVSAAKDVVRPVSDEVIRNRTDIDHMKTDIREIKEGQDRAVELLEKLVR
jgi:uncharacterized membrane protein